MEKALLIGDNCIGVYVYVTEFVSYPLNGIQSSSLTCLFPYHLTWPRNMDNRHLTMCYINGCINGEFLLVASANPGNPCRDCRDCRYCRHHSDLVVDL